MIRYRHGFLAIGTSMAAELRTQLDQTNMLKKDMQFGGSCYSNRMMTFTCC